MPTSTEPTQLTDKPLKESHQAFVQYYCSNGLNGSLAYKSAYPNCTSGERASASKLLTNPNIKAAITAIQDDFKQIMAGSREKSARDYDEARTMAMQQKQPAAAVSAIRWRDGLFGLQSLDTAADQTIIIISPPKQLNSPKRVESEVINADGPS